ncbi:ribosomal protein S18 acetylase RimI-like enzyme [Paenibacillus sp. V4I3]|uniref:GNAT family N-acetyltransferase n=1 Tax=Paenibacillus sp. V4I3 TaxID=3042305 RepID=UPI00278A3D57|nr:GNAT family N-acetyltransferase [Paenibacillus sp. V4I3]MDQ0876034.1 ribosomal protein S18 acetylase RimI-like enzyme [Paenibacillus sp. V4I3]
MITLDLMNSTEFQEYLYSAIKSYAESNVQSGNWSEQESISKATEQYAQLLPDGEKTANNKLLTIRSDGQEVGMIWLALKPNNKGYIYDIKIREDYRGRGFGKQAMEDIEKMAREFGIKSMGLHVFAHNKIARGLYEKLGYKETSIVMAKEL